MRVSEADTRMSGARLNGSRPFEKEKRGLHPIEFLPLFSYNRGVHPGSRFRGPVLFEKRFENGKAGYP